MNSRNTQVKRMQRQKGITMVESLVALVVISVGMLGIAGLYLSSLQASRTAKLRSHAVELTSSIADRIRANREAVMGYNLAADGTRRCRMFARHHGDPNPGPAARCD